MDEYDGITSHSAAKVEVSMLGDFVCVMRIADGARCFVVFDGKTFYDRGFNVLEIVTGFA